MSISAGHDIPNQINVIIEIPAYSEPVKYEYDKVNHLLHVDRFMATCMQYPANYGFVPETLSDDGDPIDVLVVTPHPLRHGSLIACRPVGMLNMTDEAGVDTKIIAVPIQKLSTLYDHVNAAEDLPALLLQQISHFFEHYKDLEKGKWVKIGGWASADEAKKAIVEAVERFNA